MTDFVQIISTIGFPIACCLAMGYFFKYITDKDREERQALSERHDNEMKEITELYEIYNKKLEGNG